MNQHRNLLISTYLNQLPSTQSQVIKRLLKAASGESYSELIDLFTELGARVRFEKELYETYLFAPSRWGKRAMRAIAERNNHPGLKQLAVLAGKQSAVRFYRESFGKSDAWLARLPADSDALLRTSTSSIAITVLGGKITLNSNGENNYATSIGMSDITVIEPEEQTKPVTVSATQETLLLITASPELGGIAPDGQWFITELNSGRVHNGQLTTVTDGVVLSVG